MSGLAYTARGAFYHSDIEDVIANSPLSTRMFIHLEWFDANQLSLRHDYSANHNGLSPDNVWTELDFKVISPTNAAWATFHVETDHDVGGGSVFGDAFYFAREQAPEYFPPPTGLLIHIH